MRLFGTVEAASRADVDGSVGMKQLVTVKSTLAGWRRIVVCIYSDPGSLGREKGTDSSFFGCCGDI